MALVQGHPLASRSAEPLNTEELVEEVDIGTLSPAVYMRIETELSGRPVAAFVSRCGDTFCLESPQVSLRIRYLESKGMDTMEEKKALKALAVVGG